MVKVTLSFPLKKISRNSIGQLTRRPSFFVYFCLLLLFFFGLGLCFYRSLMLSWVSLYLPSQWTCSRFPNRKRYEIEVMLVFCLFVCFFFNVFFQQYKLRGVLCLSSYYTSNFHLFHPIFCHENLSQRCLQKTSAFSLFTISKFFFFSQLQN